MTITLEKIAVWREQAESLVGLDKVTTTPANMLALLDLAEQSIWRPVEEHDGSNAPVLAYDPLWYDVPHPMIFNRHDKWVLWFNEQGPFKPTHFRPITPPEGDAKP